jgi:SAM-dependent methyltransferase
VRFSAACGVACEHPAVNEDQIRDVVAGYYKRRFAEHGATPRGVDWKDARSQDLRIDVLLSMIDCASDASVADVGCGYGHALRTLRRRGFEGRYVGLDFESTMIEEARRLSADDGNAEFVVGDRPPRPVDWTIASGIFNVRPGIDDDDWSRHVRATIERMVADARRGVAFNCLSLHSDAERRADHLHYEFPGELLDWCAARFSRHVALRQDYGLWEFSVAIHLEPREKKA